jgi:AcrR family transcriptional regulator
MSDKRRKYQKKRRAESEDRTRLRIAEAAVELHGTVGPALTSISAIAVRAGVRRSTVYRHFGDEAALFSACSSQWLAANPFPEIGRCAAIDDPDERVIVALQELYAYYSETERMLENVLRDESTVPVLKGTLIGYRGYLNAARDTLMIGRPTRGRARHRAVAAIGHALAFATWRSLVREQQLGNGDAADLMGRLVAAAGGSGGSAGVAKHQRVAAR